MKSPVMDAENSKLPSVLIISLFLLMSVLSLLMHKPHLQKEIVSIHAWRQTQTQSTIISFLEEDFNILNPKRNDRGNGSGIFRMEFPLMQWVVAGISKFSGNVLLTTRTCMFLTGLLSVLGMYFLLFLLFGKPLPAIAGAWAFNFAPAFFYYTINPLPDNAALCCGIWGLAAFLFWTKNKNWITLLFSAMLLSLSALCKLPFMLYFSFPGIFLLREWYEGEKKSPFRIILLTIPALLPLAWYVKVIPTWKGNGIVGGVLDHPVSLGNYLDFAVHHLVSTLPELLLNYASLPFFLCGLFLLWKNKSSKKRLFLPFLMLGISILFYFFFELNMIEKIHDYYLFPFYPILFIITCYGIIQWSTFKPVFFKGLLFLLILLMPLTAWLRMHKRWDENSPGFNKDLLVYKDQLRKAVPDDELCIAGNDMSHFIFFYYIHKKGWGFDNDMIDLSQMQNMIKKGAKYLYSDCRVVDGSENMKPYLDSLIFEAGSIKVFRLKTQAQIQLAN